ncbi:hypothetical protein MOMA_05150 [Moraxella macacae 0408225]|uniref:Uncharacterized protein n=1 Tax=Moraxella macacae 0408225 TaxID=1230338 RepID=L2F9P6_9GAMM|nr:DUF692 domain-containing protein [Moraxella macacae]ELA09762.1 hypothetical protein MOMA_05150 [Moraxella macacae 0408225]
MIHNHTSQVLQGAGLGFRRELVSELRNADLSSIDFFEVSPENWLTSQGIMGGRFNAMLREFTEQFVFSCHGLSMSIGGSGELNIPFIKNIGKFLDYHNIALFTEHLAWCSDAQGHLYDLFPIACTDEAVMWVASRIRQIQDILERQIAIENASYYYRPNLSTLSDSEFITYIVKEADCLLHLDVNNVYVNSQNFGFDADEYLQNLPLERTCYLHIAGHYQDKELIIDTHGNAVIDPVWALLDRAYELIYQKTQKQPSLLPTCLERDFNFPPLAELLSEVAVIHQKQKQILPKTQYTKQAQQNKHIA